MSWLCWLSSGRPAGICAALVRIFDKRLHPFLPDLVEALERHSELRIGSETGDKLLQMSVPTIDQRARASLGPRGRTTTRLGTVLKHNVPVRTFADWNERRPGFLEMDLVAHCGDSAAGEFLHTLCAVDIVTHWTEPVGLPNKGQKATFEGIQALRQPRLSRSCDDHLLNW